jgi:UDP-3-O-[3-hydroxymyristoyl] glucosamine N-acyltransferase
VTLTLGQIAQKLGATVEGDASILIHGVAGVRDATADEIAFVAQARYAADAEASAAGAMLVSQEWKQPLRAVLIRVDKPEAAFAQVASWFAAITPPPPPGVHPSAIVSSQARLGQNVSIGPLTVIEDGAVLGDDVVVGAQCYIGHGACIGRQSRLYQQVSIREHCQLGERVIVHNGTVIGSDGFGYHVDSNGVRTKIPQIGIVVLGDDVEVGANVTIDRARFGKTRIGRGVKIDNLVQIAHNVVIGEDAVLVSQVGISGSTIVGRKAILAGQVGVAGHLTIGDGAVVGAQGGVTKNVPPGVFVSGYPAAPHKEAAKLHAMVARLPELRARVAELQKRIASIEARLA